MSTTYLKYFIDKIVFGFILVNVTTVKERFYMNKILDTSPLFDEINNLKEQINRLDDEKKEKAMQALAIDVDKLRKDLVTILTDANDNRPRMGMIEVGKKANLSLGTLHRFLKGEKITMLSILRLEQFVERNLNS